MTLRGEKNRNKTHCPHGHEYTPENVCIEVVRGVERRHCRQCGREKASRYYWNKVKLIKHPGKPGRPRGKERKANETPQTVS